MSPAQRLCGRSVLLLALALPAGCHRRLPPPEDPPVSGETYAPAKVPPSG